MKTISTILGLVLLAACGAPDPNAQASIAQFQGENLRISWSPTSDLRAVIITADLHEDRLPVEAIDSAEFRNFFAQVTNCSVDTGETITVTHVGGRPFSILAPYTCS